jgi:hypothetical protein
MSWGVLRGLLHFFPVVGKERKGIQERNPGKERRAKKSGCFFLFLFGFVRLF